MMSDLVQRLREEAERIDGDGGWWEKAPLMREAADYIVQQDNPLHPPMIGEEGQPFRDWSDFVERVARPLVMIDGDPEAERAAMALYRQASPYFICMCLLMARNRIEQQDAELAELRAARAIAVSADPRLKPTETP